VKKTVPDDHSEHGIRVTHTVFSTYLGQKNVSRAQIPDCSHRIVEPKIDFGIIKICETFLVQNTEMLIYRSIEKIGFKQASQ